jgi:hypothetical protein
MAGAISHLWRDSRPRLKISVFNWGGLHATAQARVGLTGSTSSPPCRNCCGHFAISVTAWGFSPILEAKARQIFCPFSLKQVSKLGVAGIAIDAMSDHDPPLQTAGLEIRAAEHCNLTCAGCSQSSPHLNSAFPDLRQIKISLDRLGAVIAPSRATVIGGEPLLNPDIVEVLETVHRSRMFKEIFVTTNGLLLMSMPDRFWSLTNVVKLSVYPSSRRYFASKLPEIRSRSERFDTRLDITYVDQFRHMNLAYNIGDSQIVRNIYNSCYLKMYCHTLYDGRFYKCAPAPNLTRSISSRTGAAVSNVDDGISIIGNPNLGAAIRSYLAENQPLIACGYCLGSSGSTFPHKILNKAEVAKEAPAFRREMLDSVRLLKSFPSGSE